MIEENNGLEPTPDSYSAIKSYLDCIKALKHETNNFSDIDNYFKALDSNIPKEFSNDGSASYWLNKYSGDPRSVAQFPFGYVLVFTYVLVSNRLKKLTSETTQLSNEFKGFDAKLNDLQPKLDKVLQNQSDITAALTKLESELTSKIDADTTAIEKHATAEASRVISQFP